ncbi:hypothetical protein [Pontibacter anaerobius]|uniref:HTH cro/C1-type domain-containing protein n=1 Tax=Pontibacter anaerobius TaxID=2993940 RepID=A0ABT3RJL7_9BACT|nr:hypothetical protein [Pontibacter anaerobius]MCX2741517.1 hypothetical protein [Pontibacter anaerobius]
MLNINKLPLPEEAKQEIRHHHDKLLAVTGVKVDILEVGPEIIKVRVVQRELKNGYLLNQRQLVGRAANVVAPLMDGPHRIHFYPLTYKPDFSIVTAGWLQEKLAAFKLSRNDLAKQTNLDKTAIGRMLKGYEQPTPPQQAALYYYFLLHEVNHHIREFLDSDDNAPAEDLYEVVSGEEV